MQPAAARDARNRATHPQRDTQVQTTRRASRQGLLLRAVASQRHKNHTRTRTVVAHAWAWERARDCEWERERERPHHVNCRWQCGGEANRWFVR